MKVFKKFMVNISRSYCRAKFYNILVEYAGDYVLCV